MVNKIFFFDVDGTLLPHGISESISKYDIYALNELKKLGYKIAIATGKSFHMISDIIDSIEFDYYINSNGGSIRDNNGILYLNSFSKSDLNYWHDYANNNGYVIGMQGNEYNYILKSDFSMDFIDKIYNTFNIKTPIILDEIDDSDVLQIWMFGDIDTNKLPTKFDYFKWHPLAIDVQLKSTSKADGISKLLEIIGDEYDIYAFGDGDNDIEMLSLANKGVAMKNSSNRLFDVADEITLSVNESGVYHYLVNSGLITAYNEKK